MNENYKQQIERGVELLVLCQQLQSEKDGISRPAPGVVDKSKTNDQFAQDIGQAVTNMKALCKLIPQMQQLGDLGRKLEAEGEIEVDYGDDYADAALKFVLADHGLR